MFRDSAKNPYIEAFPQPIELKTPDQKSYRKSSHLNLSTVSLAGNKRHIYTATATSDAARQNFRVVGFGGPLNLGIYL